MTDPHSTSRFSNHLSLVFFLIILIEKKNKTDDDVIKLTVCTQFAVY